MQVIQQSVDFPLTRGFGPNDMTARVALRAPATTAAAVLTGFRAEYDRASDHHIGQLDVRIDPVTFETDTTVVVRLRYGLRGWSGEWAQPYSGRIEFAVIAE